MRRHIKFVSTQKRVASRRRRTSEMGVCEETVKFYAKGLTVGAGSWDGERSNNTFGGARNKPTFTSLYQQTYIYFTTFAPGLTYDTITSSTHPFYLGVTFLLYDRLDGSFSLCLVCHLNGLCKRPEERLPQDAPKRIQTSYCHTI